MGCSFGFIWISFKLREKMKKYANEAYEIVQYMRKYTDKITEKEHLNFSLLASAAEGVTGKFAQYDAQNAGKGYDVCKKDIIPIHFMYQFQ